MSESQPQILLGPLDSPPPREFRTPRLKLRAIKPGDSKLIFDLYASDPIATRCMSFKCAEKVEDTAAFIEPAAQYFLGIDSPVKQFIWVFEPLSGETVGSGGFGPTDQSTLTGGYILNQKFWGQGYASEAWRCLVNWAKTQTRVLRIEAWHDLENPQSGKVMLNAGMKFEGIVREHSIHPNISPDPRDAAVYVWKRES